MAKKAKKQDASYTVINGCNTSDGKRYEPGEAFDAADHPDDIEALLEMNCIEETNVDS